MFYINKSVFEGDTSERQTKIYQNNSKKVF